MEDSIIILLYEAAKISDYVKPSIYKTILGQIRSGDLAGAAKGIRRIQRRHARKNGNGARKDRKRGRKTCWKSKEKERLRNTLTT